MFDQLMQLLGGAAQGGQGGQQSDASANPLGGLLGQVLGGQSSEGGMGDLLGMALGGLDGQSQSSAASAANPLLEPLAQMLSQKLGISQATAMAVAGGALTLLMSYLSKQMGQAGSQADGGSQHSGQTMTPTLDGLQLDQLLDPRSLRSSGAVEQVAEQTGMSKTEATRSLQQAMSLLTGMADPAEQPDGGLKNLLDDWS